MFSAIVWLLALALLWPSGLCNSPRIPAAYKGVGRHPIMPNGYYGQPLMFSPPGSYYDSIYGAYKPFPGGGIPVRIDYNDRCSGGYVGIKPHPDQQRYYYVCQPNGVIFSECINLEIFNASSRHCEPHPHAAQKPACLSEYRFPYPYNCKMYYVCEKNMQPRLNDCPMGSIFSSMKSECVPGNRCPATQISDSGSYIAENCELKFPSCTAEGTFRSPSDCGLYYTCQQQRNGNYLQTRFKCPRMNSYDLEHKMCLPQQEVACQSFLRLSGLGHAPMPPFYPWHGFSRSSVPAVARNVNGHDKKRETLEAGEVGVEPAIEAHPMRKPVVNGIILPQTTTPASIEPGNTLKQPNCTHCSHSNGHNEQAPQGLESRSLILEADNSSVKPELEVAHKIPKTSQGTTAKFTTESPHESTSTESTFSTTAGDVAPCNTADQGTSTATKTKNSCTQQIPHTNNHSASKRTAENIQDTANGQNDLQAGTLGANDISLDYVSEEAATAEYDDDSDITTEENQPVQPKPSISKETTANVLQSLSKSRSSREGSELLKRMSHSVANVGTSQKPFIAESLRILTTQLVEKGKTKRYINLPTVQAHSQAGIPAKGTNLAATNKLQPNATRQNSNEDSKSTDSFEHDDYDDKRTTDNEILEEFPVNNSSSQPVQSVIDNPITSKDLKAANITGEPNLKPATFVITTELPTTLQPNHTNSIEHYDYDYEYDYDHDYDYDHKYENDAESAYPEAHINHDYSPLAVMHGLAKRNFVPVASSSQIEEDGLTAARNNLNGHTNQVTDQFLLKTTKTSNSAAELGRQPQHKSNTHGKVLSAVQALPLSTLSSNIAAAHNSNTLKLPQQAASTTNITTKQFKLSSTPALPRTTTHNLLNTTNTTPQVSQLLIINSKPWLLKAHNQTVHLMPIVKATGNSPVIKTNGSSSMLTTNIDLSTEKVPKLLLKVYKDIDLKVVFCPKTCGADHAHKLAAEPVDKVKPACTNENCPKSEHSAEVKWTPLSSNDATSFQTAAGQN